MKKLIALFLTLSLIFSCTSFLISCSDPEVEDDDGITDNEGDTSTDDTPSSPNASIVTPPFKDYGRGSVNFSELVYSTPNVAGLVAAFENACLMIDKNELSFEEQTKKLDALDKQYSTFITMYSLARIQLQKNTADEYWSTEYEKLAKNAATLTQKLEDLYVSAARSENKARFEDEYFLFSLDEFVEGGKYTDEVVALLSKESELEAEYTSLSEATVEITYNEETASAGELLEKYKDADMGVTTLITALYEAELKKLSLGIYIELVKVRREIADALDYDTYAEFAYEASGHQYSEEQMTDFLDALREDVAPVYYKLYNQVFGSYLSASLSSDQDYVKTVNTLYNVLGYTDSDFAEIYAYMLQHGLYSIDGKKTGRYVGAFTTYLDDNNSPYLFATMSNKMTDYFTLSHEFGHFADLYFNDGNQSSLDLMEVYSFGMEYLILTKLKTKMNSTDYKYLEYYAMHQAMTVLLDQGFVAAFEHLVYDLEYHEITEEKLSELATEALRSVFGNIVDGNVTADVYALMIPHIIEYPTYVQSYCTSTVVALDIFFEEIAQKGRGFEIYKALLDRTDDPLTFEEELTRVGIDSPFEENALKKLSNDIHNYFLGTDYFTFSTDDELNAA